MNTYERVSDQLKGRCANRRKIDNNTYAERHDGYIAIHLHATDIMLLKPDGSIILDSGGWLTVTTKARMNDQLRRDGWNVWSERGVWYVGRGQWDSPNRQQWAYADGMTLLPDGTVTGEGEDPRAKLKLKRRIKKYVQGFMAALDAGKILQSESGGDCFYCMMRETTSKTPLGELNRDTSHLESHMEEKYFVLSLLSRAMEIMPVSHAARWYVAGCVNPEHPDAASSKRAGEICKDQVSKALSRYIQRQFGMQA